MRSDWSKPPFARSLAGQHIGFTRRGGHHAVQIEHDADLAGITALPEHLHRFAVREVQGMGGLVRGFDVLQPGRHAAARAPAEDGRHDGFVVRGPQRHAIAQTVEDDLRVIGEPVGAIAARPTAFVLQALGQIPMMQGHIGRDPRSAQFVDQTVVKIQTAFVDRTPAGRQDARPRHRKTVGLQTEFFHQGDIGGHPVVVVASDVAGVAVGDLTGLPHEAIPDAFAFAVLVPRAFDLVSRGGRAPKESGRKGLEWCVHEDERSGFTGRGESVEVASPSCFLPLTSSMSHFVRPRLE